MRVVKKPPQVRTPVRMLPIDKLVPTPDNRRRPITQASVQSLAKSMAKDGVLQPIVVREHPEKAGHYEIRAGERRWRAAKLAGIAHMPAIVRKLDDESALSVTIAENLRRQDLHPLERAATIQQAFDRGYDVKAVAGRLGKSVLSIARRASLTRPARSSPSTGGSSGACSCTPPLRLGRGEIPGTPGGPSGSGSGLGVPIRHHTDNLGRNGAPSAAGADFRSRLIQSPTLK